MATRNLTMVVDRKHYEDFTERMMDITPYSMTEYSKVNMYLHHDGYPEWQGIQLANWLQANPSQDLARVAAKLVHDHYYDSCYLYNNPNQIDHQYTYIVFVGDGETLILCYNQYSNREVFCYTPQEVLNKYMDDMDYTDFAGGQTRCEYSGLRSTKSYTICSKYQKRWTFRC